VGGRPVHRSFSPVTLERVRDLRSDAVLARLATGLKWYETGTRKGGGGAIDLAMQVLGLSFADALKHLTELQASMVQIIRKAVPG
jgi:hypothetical protein